MKVWKLHAGLRAGAAALALAAMLTGCVSYSRIAPDGTKVQATGWFMQVGSIDSSETATNGVKRTLKVEKLRPDVAAMKAVASGVAEGLAAGATKAVAP